MTQIQVVRVELLTLDPSFGPRTCTTHKVRGVKSMSLVPKKWHQRQPWRNSLFEYKLTTLYEQTLQHFMNKIYNTLWKGKFKTSRESIANAIQAFNLS